MDFIRIAQTHKTLGTKKPEVNQDQIPSNQIRHHGHFHHVREFKDEERDNQRISWETVGLQTLWIH